MPKKSNYLEIDMIAGSELRDTQGEVLSVDGADITELDPNKVDIFTIRRNKVY